MNSKISTRHRLSTLAAIVLGALCCMTIISCSTKRNTALSRGYQRMSSRYNVYYNGREAFNSGIEAIRKRYNNDYSHVLPVYEFSNATAARAGQGDMETALKKSTKLVQLHSITVKPERGTGPLTEEEKRFRAKEEYNPYVGEGYLLMGKANVVIHEEQEAIKLFDYLDRKHEGERPSYEGKIWKAIAYTQMGQYNNAMAALKAYDMDGVAPAALYADYQAAYANLLICQEKYKEAIPYMEHAANETKDRDARRRYKYILAQLYRTTGDNAKAAPLFLSLSKGLQDFDMAFAAKMDLATVATTEEERIKAEKNLRKMVNDPKYSEQLDQIYYAIGRMDLNKGDEPAATSAFTRSVETSVTNDNQKGLSYIALADIYQAKPKYIDASLALDSAAFYLDESNERKEEATKRAAILAPLAKELRTIRDNDSLMRIAKMDSRSREKLLDKMVDDYNEKVRAEQEAREADAENAMSQTDFYNLQRNTGSSSWYFYNPQVVSAGKSTFRTRWGNRKNEDNWRRSNKSSVMPDMTDAGDGEAEGSEAQQEEAQQEYSRASGAVTRQSLMAGLPLTEAAQQQTDEQTAKAFLKSASILYDDIEDYDSSIEQLKEMLRRYPNSKDAYDALTLLHFAQARAGDTSGQQETDRQIKTKYPESLMAKNLTQPAYMQELQARHDAIERKYSQTYADYLTGNIGAAITQANQALADTATEEDYKPKYLLVRALSQAKNGNATDFRADLTTIGERYPQTPQDSVAKLLLAELDKGKLPVRYSAYDSPLDKSRESSDIAQAEKLAFAYEPDSAHLIVCLVDNGNLKRAQFKIADYNFTNYILQDYDLEMRQLPNNTSAIIIRQFANAKEASTYYYALREQAFWKELSSEAIAKIYMISKTNYALMRQTGVDDAFKAFYDEHYNNR